MRWDGVDYHHHHQLGGRIIVLSLTTWGTPSSRERLAWSLRREGLSPHDER